MATLAQLRTDAQLRLSDSAIRAFTNAEMLIFINNALTEWVNLTEEIREESAFAMTSGQFDYDAPDSMIRPLYAMWMPTRTPVEVISHNEFLSRGGYTLNQTGPPQWMCVEGVANTGYRLRLFPTPSATSASTTMNDSGGISSSDSSVILTSATSFRSPASWILIESEKILYQSVSSNTLGILRRGVGGTTAASHADGSTVTQLDLHVVYSRQPTALSSDSDIPEIDTRWHKSLIYKVMAQALVADGRDNEAAAEDMQFEREVNRAKRAIKRKQGASPRAIQTSYL